MKQQQKNPINRPERKPICPHCGSGQTYFRQTTKDHVCRLCGGNFTLGQKRNFTIKSNKEKANDKPGRAATPATE